MPSFSSVQFLTKDLLALSEKVELQGSTIESLKAENKHLKAEVDKLSLENKEIQKNFETKLELLKN